MKWRVEARKARLGSSGWAWGVPRAGQLSQVQRVSCLQHFEHGVSWVRPQPRVTPGTGPVQGRQGQWQHRAQGPRSRLLQTGGVNQASGRTAGEVRYPGIMAH